MLLVALMIGLSLCSLLLRSKALPEGNIKVTEPVTRTVKAKVDGRPVHSYIVDD